MNSENGSPPTLDEFMDASAQLQAGDPEPHAGRFVVEVHPDVLASPAWQELMEYIRVREARLAGRWAWLWAVYYFLEDARGAVLGWWEDRHGDDPGDEDV